jgi:hypothetical protein
VVARRKEGIWKAVLGVSLGLPYAKREPHIFFLFYFLRVGEKEQRQEE